MDHLKDRLLTAAAAIVAIAMILVSSIALVNSPASADQSDCKLGQTATITQTAPGEYGAPTGAGVNRLASFLVSPSDGGPVQLVKAFTRVNRGIVRAVVHFNNGTATEVNKYCNEPDGARTYFDSIYEGNPDTVESVTVWVVNT